MAEQDALREFGEPFFVESLPDGSRTILIYHAPERLTTRREEGYKGFQLVFEHGRLSALLPVTGIPSYAP
jgi:hypothetical protein